jgi:hypothetical protein
MTLTYAKEIARKTIKIMYAKASVLVGLKTDPVLSFASILRLEATTSSSHSLILSGIKSLVFSPIAPPTLPNGLLITAKSNETMPKTTADTPTAAIALVGLGTQTCCKRSDEDEGCGD